LPPGVRGHGHKYTDAPHAVCLLRARRKWPTNHRAGEKRYEIASSHARPLNLVAAWTMAQQSRLRYAGRMVTFHPAPTFRLSGAKVSNGA
jgi:hypothetical protein